MPLRISAVSLSLSIWEQAARKPMKEQEGRKTGVCERDEPGIISLIVVHMTFEKAFFR